MPLAKRGDGVTECHPLTSVGDDSPIEFEINGNGEDYIDLANTMLYVRAKVVRMNGNNIGDDTPVGPVNLFLHLSLIHISEPTRPY